MMVHCVPMSGLIESRKLYSTLRVSLLEKEGGEAAEALYDYAACYEQDIAKAMDKFRTERFPTNDLMRYFSLPHKQLETAIRSKVLSAHPTVHAERKVLYAVLELTMTRDLTVEELRAFSEQIACQYNIGWGGQLNTAISRPGTLTSYPSAFTTMTSPFLQEQHSKDRSAGKGHGSCPKTSRNDSAAACW